MTNNEKVAKKLRFGSKTYQYACAKNNILIYTCNQIQNQYDDEYDDGGVIIVKYRPEKRSIKDRYLVLHSISISNKGIPSTNNISKKRNRIPTIVKTLQN